MFDDEGGDLNVGFCTRGGDLLDAATPAAWAVCWRHRSADEVST